MALNCFTKNNMKKSNLKPILSEQDVIHFQYEENGITKNDTYMVSLEYKGEHKQAEEQFLKEVKHKYQKLKVNKVVYQ